jgi:hypothetical protein
MRLDREGLLLVKELWRGLWIQCRDGAGPRSRLPTELVLFVKKKKGNGFVRPAMPDTVIHSAPQLSSKYLLGTDLIENTVSNNSTSVEACLPRRWTATAVVSSSVSLPSNRSIHHSILKGLALRGSILQTSNDMRGGDDTEECWRCYGLQQGIRKPVAST